MITTSECTSGPKYSGLALRYMTFSNLFGGEYCRTSRERLQKILVLEVIVNDIMAMHERHSVQY